MTSFDRVQAYYADPKESRRLDAPPGQLEFEGTVRCLERWLSPRSRILDIGGGTGRYAIFLAARGHRVALADLSADLLEIARIEVDKAGAAGAVESIRQANAMDLVGYEDGGFDAVLALGPFYHLTEDRERRSALAEAHRVLKPGGLLVVAFIPPMVFLADVLRRAESDTEQVTAENFEDCARTGVFHNAAGRGMQEGVFLRPGDLRQAVEQAGFATESIRSIRSLAHHQEETVLRMRLRAPDLCDRILQEYERLAEEPSVVDLCGHALCIARKPASA